MDAFVEAQEDLEYQIENSFKNFKKLGLAKMTRGATRVRMDALEKLWARYVKAYDDLEITKVEEKHEYFSTDKFGQVRELYLERLGEFQEHAFALEAPASNSRTLNITQPLQNNGTCLNNSKLPKLDLPTFDGDYLKWSSFKSLFTAAISSQVLSDVTKITYLMGCLKGDPLDLVADQPIAEGNFTTIWDLLKAQYENNRRVVTILLQKMFAVSPMTSESAAEVKRIIKGITGPLATLKVLGRPTAEWNDVLVFLTVGKLNSQMKKDWEAKLGSSSDPPTFEALLEFLNIKQTSLEAYEASEPEKLENSKASSSKAASNPSQPKVVKSQSTAKSFATSVGKTAQKCCCCFKGHNVANCQKFLSKLVGERHAIIKHSRLCYNCLQKHKIGECQSQAVCGKCQKKHHELLHFDSNSSVKSGSSSSSSHVEVPQSSGNDSRLESVATHLISTAQDHPETVLLATAWVCIENEAGEKVTVRALIDQCSQSSFISESVAQRLRLRRKSISLPVAGIGSKRQIICKGVTEFVIKPHFSSTFSCQVVAYVIPKVSSYRPVTKKQECQWDHLQRLVLADPQYHRTGVIDVLLGAAVHARIVEGQVLKGLEHEPIATRTQLGWIISGSTSSEASLSAATPTVLHCSAESDVNELLQKFWLQEELQPIKKQTLEEGKCEQHFIENVRRLENGKYQVRLPFKSKVLPSFKDTYSSSMKLQLRMEAKFEKEEAFKNAYHSFISEYIQLGDMALHSKSAEENVDLDNCCFLPHHGVLKDSSSTTKLRSVFNGSMKTRQGYAVNDFLYVGENLLPDLALLTLSWRNYKYAFTADIEKMFRQILVHPDDQRWQLINWRFDPSQPVEIYRLKTVTYGLGCSPFLANRVVKQLAADGKDEFPLGSDILAREIYMDDVLSGSHCLKIARSKQQELLELSKAGGFKLRKWLANDESLLSLPEDLLAIEPSKIAKNESCFAILGLKWQPSFDHFQFLVKEEEQLETWTKRLVLSRVAKLFDPLGWLAPTVIVGKIFLQQLWLLNLNWDEVLPHDKAQSWVQWFEQLAAVNEIKIPRWTGFMPSALSLQLHGFGDASKTAYGAVVYLRTVTSTGVTVSLLQAKSKVAPVKTLSIPRLELSAAHLLAKLVHRILPLFDSSKLQVYLWSDSLDVLHWLREIPSKWPTFIANRCADIHNLVPIAHWSHVRTEHNPADYVSRGVLPSDLVNLQHWWLGPTWLCEDQDLWPASLLQFQSTTQSSDSPPTPDSVTCALVVKKRIDNIEKLQGVWKLFEGCSTWSKLVRRLAYFLRLVDYLMKKRPSKSDLFSQVWYSVEYNIKDSLSVIELERSRIVWVYLAQRYHFEKDIFRLASGRALVKPSVLYDLDPFLSESLLLVGGRLKHSLLSLDEKHPLILPSDSRVSKLIIKDFHVRSLHGGVQLTLSSLRRQYWIIGGRQKVKSVIKCCHPCIRFRASEYYQKMGNLPQERIRPSRPFEHSGVDYAGPIQVRAAPGRGHKSYKGYIAIFVCLSTKAVHLEVVSDLTTQAFIAAFRRFTALRGPCRLLWSDQGTNFIGADNELRSLYQQSSAYMREIKSVLARENTEWRFNPPAAPHFGGIWEAAVKSTKYHIRRVLGDNTLTYEEMATLLAQIQACLNSRPLTTLTDDPSDVQPLTPAHFLIQAPSYIVPEPNYTETKIPASRRWQIVQQMMQGFWRRWSQEYLQSLQKRSKWQSSTRSFKVNDLVILRQENVPPAQWPLARIVAVQPDAKGLVRTVTVRTANSTFDRPAVKLILLPKEEDDHEDS